MWPGTSSGRAFALDRPCVLEIRLRAGPWRDARAVRRL